ncbi:MAG: DUF11 domain-containing protein [Caldilineaceae bacterium]|nr:DUF11 domain-containing protein [Caldilineaceae bacterium]MBP8107632.1 DUF11 domain-containing protein [Caldilineaceae bacterium]MBP9072742.1 DUF11 domain-containing protein [Caldilineaceae bacterium]
MPQTNHTLIFRFFAILVVASLLLPAGLINNSPAWAASAGTPVLTLAHGISQEPLLGGQVTYSIRFGNNGATPVTDKGYNLTVTDTLPVGLSFVSAAPAPTFVSPQTDGTTQIVWDNLTDIEVNETQTISLVANLAASLTVSNQFVNQVSAKVNSAPDNSGAWITASAKVAAYPQAVDINVTALQSTGVHQATGAGEYDGGADWPYQYRVTVKNNNIGATQTVTAVVTLPAGVAYLGGVVFGSNPNGVSTTPVLALQNDGSLKLTWGLGALTTAQYATPIQITFNTGVPYRFRTKADSAAASGPYAGPMSGSVIPEDTMLAVDYEATGRYANFPTSDGTQSTPADDSPIKTTADFLTVSKGASPKVVGIDTVVDYTLHFYVSEYYTVTNSVLMDVLPDGMEYVKNGATIDPASIEKDSPGDGQTTLIWKLDPATTLPGKSGVVTFKAKVNEKYQAKPYNEDPLVSGDSLTNRVTIYGDWQDVIQPSRSGTTTSHSATATVSTRMPTFGKEVYNPQTSQWGALSQGFTGDTATFRLTFDSAADVDAKAIVIRDFLPRGMTFISGSDVYNTSGKFEKGSDCSPNAKAPTVGTLSGLQYLEWALCNVSQGSHWQVTLDAHIGETPNVEPGWLVANFGKLSGQNTYAAAYSLRGLANVAYVAPNLVLTKSASPDRNLRGGDTVKYTVSVTNNGKATAYNVVMTDTIPANLIVPNSGGSASPTASSYTTVSGNPSTGSGGVLRWAPVAALAAGQTQSFTYQATIPQGLPAGASMTNLASVAYSNRSDDLGHKWAATTNINDDNTGDATVYLRGITIKKSGSPAQATIGDTVHWILNITVPAGVKGYWPVVEENDLPLGFVYVPGSTVVSGGSLDTAHHATIPWDNGNLDLRWYLNTLDNSAGSTDATVTLEFDSLVTGVQRTDVNTKVYLNNCCLENATNKVFVGWYDNATGYKNTGYAYEGISTANIDRRSPHSLSTVKIRQPNLDLQKSADTYAVGAGDVVTFTLQFYSNGNDVAYDITLTDTLPAGMTFGQTVNTYVTYPSGFPQLPVVISGNNTPESRTLAYQVDLLYVGMRAYIVYTAQVDPAISADLALPNVAQITQYSSKPGVPADSNGDGLADERTYTGPTAQAILHTDNATISKEVGHGDELIHGSTLAYTLTVPAAPINATIYNAHITDSVDSRLQILGVSNGSANGNTVTANFASIPPGEQRQVVIQAQLPVDSTAVNGEIIANQAVMRYDNDPDQALSNPVANTVVVPAFTLNSSLSQPVAAAGDVLTVTIDLSNVGGGRADDVTLANLLPANLAFVNGSAQLDGAPLADPVNGSWSLGSLAGGGSRRISVRATVNSVAQGDSYVNTATVSGVDSLGRAIPADNSVRVPADTDSTDTSAVRFYGGPLAWTSDSTFVAYEDLKNTGWSDWDYNDFVVRIDVQKGLTPDGGVAVLLLNYEALSRGAGFNHQFLHTLPVEGGGRYQVIVRDAKGAVVSTANQPFATNTSLPIFARTKDALPVQLNLPDALLKPFTNTRPEQTYNVKGYTGHATVVLDDASANLDFLLPPLPWDPYIFVYDTGETVHLIQPGHLDNSQVVNGTYDPYSPMIGYDLPLAQVFDPTWHWPEEFIGIWRGYPDYVRFKGSGGSANTDWFAPTQADDQWLWLFGPTTGRSATLDSFNGPEADSRYFASPVVADLNGDGTQEIVIGNLLLNRVEVYDAFGRMRPGWPQSVGSSIKAAAALADLDNDGLPEILVGATDGKLYVFHADGTALAGWPVTVESATQQSGDAFRILATPAVANLDGDPAPEVVVPLSNGKLYAFHADGSPVAGWPVSLGDVAENFNSQVVNSSPIIADIDGNGRPEIIVGSYDKGLYAYHSDGSLAWRFATADVILSSPAVADMDPARPGLEVVVGSGDSYVYLLDKDGSQIWRKATGWVVRSSPLVADMDGNGDLEILIGSDYRTDQKVARLWAWHADGSVVTGWPKTTGADIFSSPRLGDVTGDGVVEILVGADDAKVYAWAADGTPVTDWPKVTGQSVKGTPVLVNLDGDPAQEVVVGDFGGTLYIWGGPALQTIFMPLIFK